MSRQTRKVKLPKYAMTFQGLQMWHNAMFEKLGWMVLADAKGYDGKIAEYKKSVNRLIEAITYAMKKYEDHNRKHDLSVLLMNAEVLKEHVDKDF